MKYALVTGGSRGIGRAIALRLAKMEYHVLVNYINNSAAAGDVVEKIKSEGGEATPIQFNVADKENIKLVLGEWLSANPEECIEVLVNNAGIRKDNLMIMMSDDEWQSVLDIHLGGFFYVTSQVLTRMIRNKYGRIINVVSLSGVKGMAGQTNYSAAKAGVIAATKSLAQEIGRKKITVNCVAPGFIKTDMTEDIDETQWRNFIPVRRFGTADEVAATVSFLASKEAAYINGEVINVNGGLYT